MGKIISVGDSFEQDKYHFKAIKPTRKHYPYRVRCLETNGEDDSSISYEDAAALLVAQYNFKL